MGPKSKTSLMGMGVGLISAGTSWPTDTNANAMIKIAMIAAGVVLIFIKYRTTAEGINIEGGNTNVDQGEDSKPTE